MRYAVTALVVTHTRQSFLLGSLTRARSQLGLKCGPHILDLRIGECFVRGMNMG